MRGFRRAVLEATAAIPYGANRKLFAGGGGGRRQPAAVRAAGTALATNPLPIIVPCHRVLRATGWVVGRQLAAAGGDMKRALLAMEAAGADRALWRTGSPEPPRCPRPGIAGAFTVFVGFPHISPTCARARRGWRPDTEEPRVRRVATLVVALNAALLGVVATASAVTQVIPGDGLNHLRDRCHRRRTRARPACRA